MKRQSIMVLAGEASGDAFAAELVAALRDELTWVDAIPSDDYQPLHASLEPRFFGMGGPAMGAAGVELEFDMTRHSVIGLSDVWKNLGTFRRIFKRLYDVALEREPDVILCVDFSGFNRRFAHAIRAHIRSCQDWFHDWDPKLVQYVSPQVWASREGRARQMAEDYHLLLCTFPFEREWYRERVSEFPVEFVGNPIIDRYREVRTAGLRGSVGAGTAKIVLLPGSRPGEIRRHLGVLLEAAKILSQQRPCTFRLVLPTSGLLEYVRGCEAQVSELTVQIGDLAEALKEADLAITKSGTITLECAYFGVPAVVFYKTSAFNYLVGKQVVKVKHLAMPNVLAKEQVYPEFVQDAASGKALAAAGLELLTNEARREGIRRALAAVVASLGPPGASRRAARAIVRLVQPRNFAASEAAARERPALADQPVRAA